MKDGRIFKLLSIKLDEVEKNKKQIILNNNFIVLKWIIMIKYKHNKTIVDKYLK